jgi:hypothetical protein
MRGKFILSMIKKLTIQYVVSCYISQKHLNIKFMFDLSSFKNMNSHTGNPSSVMFGKPNSLTTIKVFALYLCSKVTQSEAVTIKSALELQLFFIYN